MRTSGTCRQAYGEPLWDVYALADPRTLDICYIGISVDPEWRLAGHLYKSKRGQRTPKNDWMRELLSENLIPKVIVLEQGLWRERALKAERRWIVKGLEEGWPLLNVNKRRMR